MTGIENLSLIKDTDTLENIQEITKCFVAQVNPLKVILFGSFADGTYSDDSDFDFYIVIDDGRNVGQATDTAYHSILTVKKRPVDIVVGTNSRFERKGQSAHSLMVEGEVQRNGILLYDQAEWRMRYESSRRESKGNEHSRASL